MNFSATLAVALRALRVNALRSGLTMLGIIIGVAAVITMVAVGAGAQDRVEAQIQSLGSNLIIVFNGSGRSGRARLGAGSALSLTEADTRAIANEVPGIEVAAPRVRRTTQLVVGNLNWSASTQGTTPDYLVARDWDIESGRALNEEDVRSSAKVVLLGQTIVDNLFIDIDPIGASIRIK